MLEFVCYHANRIVSTMKWWIQKSLYFAGVFCYSLDCCFIWTLWMWKKCLEIKCWDATRSWPSLQSLVKTTRLADTLCWWKIFKKNSQTNVFQRLLLLVYTGLLSVVKKTKLKAKLVEKCFWYQCTKSLKVLKCRESAPTPLTQQKWFTLVGTKLDGHIWLCLHAPASYYACSVDWSVLIQVAVQHLSNGKAATRYVMFS